MSKRAETLIIGGGVWGLSTAYHLARAGHEGVRVLERNAELFAETTSQAAGLVGQIRSTPLMMAAVRYAVEFFLGFERETGYDPGFRQVGSLLLALTPERMESYKEQVDRANNHGVEAYFVDEAEISRLAPSVEASRVLGGYFVPKDGYLDPQSCARAFANASRDLGVEIQSGTEVRDLLFSAGRVVGVETDSGSIKADRVVVTAGPWTGEIARMAGSELAMLPIRYQRVTTVPVEGIPGHHPVVRITDVSCYMRPEDGGYLYGYFESDPTGYDLKTLPLGFETADIEPPIAIMEDARDRLAPIFPNPAHLQIAERKQGLTTFTPDGAYVIGPLPQVEGLYAATGCAALGIAGSAAIGRWLAEWIIKGEPEEDLSTVAPKRFGERSSNREWVEKVSKDFYSNYYSIASMSVT